MESRGPRVFWAVAQLTTLWMSFEGTHFFEAKAGQNVEIQLNGQLPDWPSTAGDMGPKTLQLQYGTLPPKKGGFYSTWNPKANHL